jgi:hypothetical protein
MIATLKLDWVDDLTAAVDVMDMDDIENRTYGRRRLYRVHQGRNTDGMEL